jgi:hypothetical protein
MSETRDWTARQDSIGSHLNVPRYFVPTHKEVPSKREGTTINCMLELVRPRARHPLKASGMDEGMVAVTSRKLPGYRSAHRHLAAEALNMTWGNVVCRLEVRHRQVAGDWINDDDSEFVTTWWEQWG